MKIGQAEDSKTYELLGVRINAVGIPEVIGLMEGWICEKKMGNYIVAANTHVVMEACDDSAFAKILKDSALTIPDGTPLFWMGRRRGFELQERAYGPDLMRLFMEKTSGKGYRHFFYGGNEETLRKLSDELKRRFPEANICGSYAPPFRALTPEEDVEVIRKINQSCPDVLWVGLGCPKQEKWIYEHRESVPVPVMIGVGQAFEIYASVKKHAPQWMREHGLEWCFRLAQDPKRLWRRYLVQGSRFVLGVFLEEVGLERRKSIAKNFKKQRDKNAQRT